MYDYENFFLELLPHKEKTFVLYGYGLLGKDICEFVSIKLKKKVIIIDNFKEATLEKNIITFADFISLEKKDYLFINTILNKENSLLITKELKEYFHSTPIINCMNFFNRPASNLINTLNDFNINGYLREMGWLSSFEKKEPVDKFNSPIPWYTYPAIEYLTNIDFSNKSIFEFGSGNSTYFWNKNAKDIYSLEHNEKWYKKLTTNMHKDFNITLKKDTIEYINYLSTLEKKFDVIIIDGIERNACAKIIKNSLKDEFMVILDNSDWYKNTAKYLKKSLNAIEIDFHGTGPINQYSWTTSIFLSRNFDFPTINGMQPHYSKSALLHKLD